MSARKMSLAALFLKGGVLFYRKLISPCLPKNCCRYTPSCSQYALDALETHGAIYGAWLTFKRLLRCSPFGGSGYDPVPPALTPDERLRFYKKALILCGFVILCVFGSLAADKAYTPVHIPLTAEDHIAEAQKRTQFNPAVRFLRWIILFYQDNISSHLPKSCRFTPSCSQYGLQAVEKYGAVKGSWLTLKRIVRCNPWSDGGEDPVP